MYSEDFVSTVPFGGIGGGFGRVRDLARGLIQAHLASTGTPGTLGPRLTASPVSPLSRQKFFVTALGDSDKIGGQH